MLLYLSIVMLYVIILLYVVLYYIRHCKNLIFQLKQLHENASVEKIKNEQIIFLCLIKLDSSNRKIYLHYCLR